MEPEANLGEVFPEAFGVAGHPSSPLVGEDSLPQEPQAIGLAGLVRGSIASRNQGIPLTCDFQHLAEAKMLKSLPLPQGERRSAISPEAAR